MYWPLVEQTEGTHGTCPNHRYNVVVRVQTRIMLQGTGTASPKVGEVSFANDYRATPENAREIIEAMIKTNGVSVWREAAPVDNVNR